MKTLICKVDGFDIYFEPLEEYATIDKEWSDDEEMREDTIAKLESGEWVMFCAHVTAEKNGNVFGDDYLGMCIYTTYEEFYTKYKDDYFADMKDTALTEAKKEMQQLINEYYNKPVYISVNSGGMI